VHKRTPITAKQGLNYVDAFAFDNFVRWGDYTGISRRHSSIRPEVWLSGSYGTTQTLFGDSYRSFGTWISAFSQNDTTTAGLGHTVDAQSSVYPNPAVDFFRLEFELPAVTEISIELTEISGHFQKILFKGLVKKGKNILSFNTSGLASGIYALSLTANNQQIAQQKIILN
jgi:hypothetical protein